VVKNTSPSLYCSAAALYLSQQVTIAQCIAKARMRRVRDAVLLLHDYLKSCNRPVHLVGHAHGRFGATVCASISRNSQVFNPIRCGYSAVDCASHYYVHRQVLSRQEILTAMVYNSCLAIRINTPSRG